MYTRIVDISRNNSFFLFGARGTGKSTYLKSMFSQDEALILDLLLPEHFDPLLRSPQSLVAQVKAMPESKKWIIIDEVQKIPALLDIVHYLIENEKKYFALTGSSARKLKRGQANLLAGRAFIYHLFPLTHKELGDRFILNETLNYGALPKIFDFEDIGDKQMFLNAYAHTYLKEEIMAEQVIRSLSPFRRFLEVAAQMNGELINYSSIAKDIGVDDKTVKTYFQILEDTLVGFFIDPYHKSIRKTQLHSPRFYFFDCGVKRALQGTLASPLVESSYGYGKTFEHFIVSEIMRLNTYYKSEYKLYYLRTQSGSEIDLILERTGQKTILIEIKSTELVREDHLTQLKSFQKDLKGSEAMCLSRDPHIKSFETVTSYPWKEGLEKIFS